MPNDTPTSTPDAIIAPLGIKAGQYVVGEICRTGTFPDPRPNRAGKEFTITLDNLRAQKRNALRPIPINVAHLPHSAASPEGHKQYGQIDSGLQIVLNEDGSYSLISDRVRYTDEGALFVATESFMGFSPEISPDLNSIIGVALTNYPNMEQMRTHREAQLLRNRANVLANSLFEPQVFFNSKIILNMTNEPNAPLKNATSPMDAAELMAVIANILGMDVAALTAMSPGDIAVKLKEKMAMMKTAPAAAADGKGTKDDKKVDAELMNKDAEAAMLNTAASLLENAAVHTGKVEAVKKAVIGDMFKRNYAGEVLLNKKTSGDAMIAALKTTEESINALPIANALGNASSFSQSRQAGSTSGSPATGVLTEQECAAARDPHKATPLLNSRKDIAADIEWLQKNTRGMSPTPAYQFYLEYKNKQNAAA